MRRTVLALHVLIVGCARPPLGGEGESCTKRADCADSLGCFGGVCSAAPSADDEEVPAEPPAATVAASSEVDTSQCEAHARSWGGAWTLTTVATEATHQAWVGGTATYEIELMSDACKLSGSGRRVQGDKETWGLSLVGNVGHDGRAEIRYQATGKDVRGTWTLGTDGAGAFRSDAGDVSGTVASVRGARPAYSSEVGGSGEAPSISGLKSLQGPFESLDDYCRKQAAKNPGPETEECRAVDGKGRASAEIAGLGRVEVFQIGDTTMLSYVGLAISHDDGTFIFPKVIEESHGSEFHSFLTKTRLRPDGRRGVLQAEFTVDVFETDWVKPNAPRVEQPTRERTEQKQVLCGTRVDGTPGCKVD